MDLTNNYHNCNFDLETLIVEGERKPKICPIDPGYVQQTMETFCHIMKQLEDDLQTLAQESGGTFVFKCFSAGTQALRSFWGESFSAGALALTLFWVGCEGVLGI